MTRLTLFALLLMTAGCHSNTAEVNCGAASCIATQRCEATSNICVVDEGPTVVISSPLSGALIAGETMTLSGKTTDDNGKVVLELSTDDGHAWVKVPVSGEHFNARVALPSADFQPFALMVRATDSHQQTSVAKLTVTVDNVAPQVTLTAPMVGAKLNLAWFAGTPEVNGLAIDGSGDLLLTIDIGSGPQELPVTQSAFKMPWQAIPTDDGIARMIRVHAVDLAGNVTVVERPVTVDVVAPSLSFGSPAADALLGPQFFEGGGRVQGSVAAGASVVVNVGTGPQMAAVADGLWSVSYPTPIGLDYQPQRFTAVATDPAGNESRVEQTVTIDVVAPKLKFLSPAPMAKFNAAQFTAGDDVTVDWSISDGDVQTVVRNGLAAVSGTSVKVTTSSTDNPKTYSVQLLAQDRAGNFATAALSFTVDRVPPKVTGRAPLAGSRNNAPLTSVDFSEPVSGADDGIVLSPGVCGGGWTSPTHFEFANLPSDSVFSATVGAVKDAFGNPAAQTAPLAFHTAPRLVASGTALLTDVFQFKAAVDPDGVLSVLTTGSTMPANYRWARVNPKTGAVEDNSTTWLPTMGRVLSGLDVYAWSSVKADLSSRRVQGARTILNGNITQYSLLTRFDDDTATVDVSGMTGLIPTQPFAAEGATSEVGYVRWSANALSYLRPGAATSVPLSLGNPTAIGYSNARWELAEVKNQVLKRRSYGCVTYFANSPASCELTPVSQLTDLSPTEDLSFAMSDSCSVFAYNSTASGGSRAVVIDPYAPTCHFPNCPSSSVTHVALSVQTRVAVNRREDNSFVGARQVVGGVQLMKLALNSSCQGSWTDVGVPVAVPAVAVPAGAAFEPVSLGGKPALLYVDTSFVLKAYVP